MATNSKVRVKKAKVKKQSGASTDSSNIQKATNFQKKLIKPDYSSMKAEIKKISKPVSWEELKSFYGIV